MLCAKNNVFFLSDIITHGTQPGLIHWLQRLAAFPYWGKMMREAHYRGLSPLLSAYSMLIDLQNIISFTLYNQPAE